MFLRVVRNPFFYVAYPELEHYESYTLQLQYHCCLVIKYRNKSHYLCTQFVMIIWSAIRVTIFWSYISTQNLRTWFKENER